LLQINAIFEEDEFYTIGGAKAFEFSVIDVCIYGEELTR
jgi:hypothetical protein